MPNSTPLNDVLETVARILLRCWIFGFLILLLWFAACTLASDLVYGVHASMFDLQQDQLKAIHYCGMGFLKLSVAVFFFIPWVSIRMVLKRRQATR